MEPDKKDIVIALTARVRELQQGIDLHCCLVKSLFEGNVGKRNLRSFMDLCPKRSREQKLEKALKEAIDVLEESRQAFKSKRLEALRKNLTRH